jgi:serine phosphatase RsbU (regulator of sigma subunit)
VAQTDDLIAPPGRPVAVAGVTRPYPGEVANGDAWQARWHGAICRLAVIDGLGHGPSAASAAAAALAALAETSARGLETTLRVCHEALIGTRGAAISLADVDLTARQLTYVGVGNVEARLWLPTRTQRLITQRGIVGAILPTLRTFEAPLATGWHLVMHSDGVSARFELSGLDGSPTSGEADPQRLAEAILERWSRTTDDATVLVACAAKER